MTVPSFRLAVRWRRLAVILFISVAFAHNLASTWQRWGDLIVDCGRELDTPKQLLAGKMLYRDVRYWYGPAAPYANAWLYGIFGTRVSVLVGAGLATAAAISWLTYRTVRLLADRFAASAAAVAVLYINAFPQYYIGNIYNFVQPYAYPATYGMAAALASVYFLLRHVLTGRPTWFYLSCTFLAVTALCKIEVLFAVAVAHLIFLVIWIAISRQAALCHLWGYLAALAIPAAVFGWFYARVGGALLSDNLFLLSNVTTGGFALEHSGLTDPTRSLARMGWSVAWVGASLTMSALLARWESWREPGTTRATVSQFLPILTAFAVGGLCGLAASLLGPSAIFRALPLVLVVAVLITVVRAIIRRREPGGEMALLILAGFGLASMTRILLRCSAEHYGFYLMLPGIAALAVIWCRGYRPW